MNGLSEEFLGLVATTCFFDRNLLIYDLHQLIVVQDGDSGGISETDETSQRTRRGGDGSSLTPRNASVWNGNQRVPHKIPDTITDKFLEELNVTVSH